MPRQKGMVLTERDRAFLGYLGVARYVTAAQAHRLLAPGHDKAITSRRLARLCEGGPKPGDGAYLRRHEYHRGNGLPLPVWTLAPHGRAVAERVAPGPVAAVEAGAGVRFVERVLALDEILLALVIAARRSEESPLLELPFRWRAAGEPLRFEIRDRFHPTPRVALLRPGAILDVPRAARRFFLEPEVGATSLTPEDPRGGHVKHRLDRYSSFFLRGPGWDPKEPFYRMAFPDGFHATVLVLALSEARQSRIEKHVKGRFHPDDPRYGMRALTWPSAAAELTSLVKAASTPAPQGTPRQAPHAAATAPPNPQVRTVAIDADLARKIRHGMLLFVDTYNAIRRETSAHASVCPLRFQLAPGPLPS